MKNIFKFAAMAFAAVVLAGGATSCDPDQEEPKHPLDGKQWVTKLEETGFFLNFGVTEANMACKGYCDLTDYMPLMTLPMGSYSFQATDETSGFINISDKFMDEDENGNEVEVVISNSFPYMNLTESSVDIDTGILMGMPSEGEEIIYLPFTLAPKKIAEPEE